MFWEEAGGGGFEDEFIVLVDAEDAVRAEAFDGEGTGDADGLLVLVGLVVEVFGLGFGGDTGVDGFLAGDAGAQKAVRRGWMRCVWR